MIIYLLTLYLFEYIEKKILESLMRIILLLKGNFDKFWKMHVQVYIFFFCFVLGIIRGDRCDKKTPKTIYLFK